MLGGVRPLELLPKSNNEVLSSGSKTAISCSEDFLTDITRFMDLR
jgi:hypothetical protein